MTVFIGKKAFDFIAPAVTADNKITEDFSLSRYILGQKGILFFYPLDFTFVCPTEIIAFNNRLADFDKRGTKVIGVSIDSHFCHLAWKNTTYDKGGIGQIQFPLVADLKKSIARDYNVLGDAGIAFRGAFLIDKDFVIRHYSVNDLPLGRNIDELLRLLDALDHFNEHGEVCPAGWTLGKGAIRETQNSVGGYLRIEANKL